MGSLMRRVRSGCGRSGSVSRASWSRPSKRRSMALAVLARQAERTERENRDHELHSSVLALEAGLLAVSKLVLKAPAQSLEIVEALLLETHALRRIMESSESRKLQTFDLASTVRSWAALENATGMRLNIALPSALLVHGCAASTVEVLRKLLDNARRHAADQPVVISAAQHAAGVDLFVADCGPGIEEGLAVFERGTSGCSSTGLGLFLAVRIMQQQHGDLRIVPSERGAVFALRFPTADVESPCSPACREQTPALALARAAVRTGEFGELMFAEAR